MCYATAGFSDIVFANQRVPAGQTPYSHRMDASPWTFI